MSSDGEIGGEGGFPDMWCGIGASDFSSERGFFGCFEFFDSLDVGVKAGNIGDGTPICVVDSRFDR